MTKFTFEGQGRTTGDVDPKMALLIIGAVLLLGSGGAVAAVTAALIEALFGALIVVALVVAAVVVFVVYRARHPEAVSRMIPRPQFHELGGERPEVGQRMPRELHQHMHLHFGAGADPRAVEEIIRRSQRPEQ